MAMDYRGLAGMNLSLVQLIHVLICCGLAAAGDGFIFIFSMDPV